MDLAKAIGDLAADPPEPFTPRWWYARTVPPVVKAAELVFAAAVISSHPDLPVPSAVAGTLSALAGYANINPKLALAATVAAHAGGICAMTLLERLLKPIIVAQRKAALEQGIAEGEQRAQARFEAWKQRQADAGVTFADTGVNSNLELPGSFDY